MNFSPEVWSNFIGQEVWSNFIGQEVWSNFIGQGYVVTLSVKRGME